MLTDCQITEIPFADVCPTVDAVLSAQGVRPGNDASERLASLSAEAIEQLKAQARPAGITRAISHGEFAAMYLTVPKHEDSTPLSLIFPRADSLALFAVTIGEPVCDMISKLFSAADFAAASMLDAAASDATERAADWLEREWSSALRDRIPGPPRATMRFSPGYCGWAMEGQSNLFGYLRPKEIGISLGESYLMKPLKSISGVILAGRSEIFEFDDNYPFCENCSSRACRERLISVRKK